MLLCYELLVYGNERNQVVLQYLFDPVAAGVMVAIVRRPGDEAICRRFSMKFLIVLMRLTNYNAIAPTRRGWQVLDGSDLWHLVPPHGRPRVPTGHGMHIHICLLFIMRKAVPSTKTLEFDNNEPVS